MTFLIVIGSILGLVIGYLVVIIFFPIMKVKPLPFEKQENIKKKAAPDCREDVSFRVHEDMASGWFYLPNNVLQSVPCIVMSHGFGGTKDAVLEKYALRFREAGYAVLTYDYRHYGDSEGQPRQILSVREQLDDLREAIKYVRGRQEVDPEKIILWGTSAGANYGIVIAGENESITGVIAQCGAYDHKEDSRVGMERDGFLFYLKLFIHGQRDKGRSRFGLSRHMLPAYGKPDTVSFFTTPGVFEGAQKLAEESENFTNEVCAGFLLMPHGPDVLECAVHVKCPVLIQVCEKDEIISPKSHVKLVNILKDKAEVHTYPIGHFDIYHGEHYEKAIETQLAFVEKLVD